MGRFRDSLATPGLAAIAEIKRRSPSAGDLRPGADPARLAPELAAAGAAAISVLVDERFGGSLDDLVAARAATRAPILAKGFFSQEDQLTQIRRSGADAVLLILRDLDDARCAELIQLAAELGMDALVEAHDAEEVARAARLGADPLGINARDLATFRIDRRAQLELVAQAAALAAAPEGRAGLARGAALQLPRDGVVIAESGVSSRAQGAAAELAGADAILVGSALMQAPDPAAKLRELLSRPLVKVCGLTRQEDVDVAVEAGADLAGFILARETPRRAPGVLDVPDTMLSVAVWVGDAGETEADLDQLYALENGHRSRDGVLLRQGEPVAAVVDRPWQEEDPEHLARAAAAQGRVMLAGGLSAENVRAAIEAVRPWAVDASSSLEVEPGIKDHAKVRAYVEAARWTRYASMNHEAGETR